MDPQRFESGVSSLDLTIASKTAMVMARLVNMCPKPKPLPYGKDTWDRCVEFFAYALEDLEGDEVYSVEIAEVLRTLPKSEIVVQIDGKGSTYAMRADEEGFVESMSSTTASISCLVFPLFNTEWVVLSEDIGAGRLIRFS